MTFINPIDLLGLTDFDLKEIDGNRIRRAKRKLQAEISLSDNGSLEYGGRSVTWSEAEAAIGQLEDSNSIHFYHFIASYKALNDFLVYGKAEIFNSFRLYSIYKQPGFIKLVSTAFAAQYDRLSYNAFIRGNSKLLARVYSIAPLVSEVHLDLAYKSIDREIRLRNKATDQIAQQISNESSPYNEDNISGVVNEMRQRFDIDSLNALPVRFQEQRNQTGLSLRNLAVSIYNSFGNADVAKELIDYALDIEVTGVAEKTLFADLEKINKIQQDHQKQEAHLPLARKYANVLTEINRRLDRINSKAVLPVEVIQWATENIRPDELNQLGEEFSKLRNYIALGLRGLAVAAWNKHREVAGALSLIYIANDIEVTADTKTILQTAKHQLVALKQRRPAAAAVSSARKEQTSDERWGLLLLLFVIIVGFFAWYNADQKRSRQSASNQIPPTHIETPSHPEESESISVNKFVGNQLKNGSSPYDACFGKGVYTGRASLTVKNGTNRDAVICLYDLATRRVVRNEYIRKHSQFKMTKIPQGLYKLRVFFGNDWSPEAASGCGIRGAFTSDIGFTEFDQSYFLEDNATVYTVATVTLHSVREGNASTNTIDAAQFFSK